MLRRSALLFSVVPRQDGSEVLSVPINLVFGLYEVGFKL